MKQESKAQTLTQALIEAAARGRGGIHLLDAREEERWLGWEELLVRSRRAAAGLGARGVEPGERVALVFPTGEEFLAAFFAVLFAGAVPAPVYPPLRLGRLDEYYERTVAMWRAIDASLILTDRRAGRLLGPAVERARPRRGCLRLADLPSVSEREEREVSRQGSDLALIQFSSGTTTAPKPVALSERAVLAQVNAFNALFPDSGEVQHSGVSWLPLYHDMGLIGALLGAVARGAELTLIPPEVFLARPAVWLRAISRFRATVSPAPNFAFGLANDRIRDDELEGVDLSSWRLALNGAEPVVASTLRRFSERFAPYGFDPAALTPVYGLAEAALAVTFSPVGEHFASQRFTRRSLEVGGRVEAGTNEAETCELVSLGQALPGFELSVRDKDGGELEEGRVGRVWLTGPSLMDGYFGLPAASAAVLEDGWLDSGDEGFLWNGDLYVTGRAKETLIRHGRNFSATEIEAVAGEVEGMRTGCAAAVARRPDDGGEEVVLLAERRAAASVPSEALAAAVRSRVRTRLGLSLDRVVILAPGALPRTSSGKIRRREALSRFAAGTLEAPKRVGWLGLARALARSRHSFSRFHREDHDGAS